MIHQLIFLCQVNFSLESPVLTFSAWAVFGMSESIQSQSEHRERSWKRIFSFFISHCSKQWSFRKLLRILHFRDRTSGRSYWTVSCFVADEGERESLVMGTDGSDGTGGLGLSLGPSKKRKGLWSTICTSSHMHDLIWAVFPNVFLGTLVPGDVLQEKRPGFKYVWEKLQITFVSEEVLQ